MTQLFAKIADNTYGDAKYEVKNCFSHAFYNDFRRMALFCRRAQDSKSALKRSAKAQRIP